VAALLAACDRFTDWHGATGQENAQRLRALVLFLRYSALRIGDPNTCAVDRLSGHKLFLRTRKTGVPASIPLPQFVVEALAGWPRKSERYWFWTGEGFKVTVTGNWRRTFRRLCAIAGIKSGHPRRFRDTLTVELLLEGVPMERVSILLGHPQPDPFEICLELRLARLNPWGVMPLGDLHRRMPSGPSRHAPPRHCDPGYIVANGSDIPAKRKGEVAN
jgi:integrase